MKNSILFLVCCFSTLQLYAQEARYLQEVFTDVKVTEGLTYGVNATLLTLYLVGKVTPEMLLADVYEPVGDSLQKRPLVIVMHDGNFLPSPQNGIIIGRRSDSSAVEICTRLAKMGYVAASIDYRLGWNPLASTQKERALGFIQAIYRAMQDVRTAIRYFKKTVAEADNPYQVDSSRVVVWGNGTGGYIGLGAATLDNYNELLTTTHKPEKFLLDLDDDGIPDLPMIVEAVHGDIEGKTVGIGIPTFGVPQGDTLSYANHIAYSSDFQLSVNIGGGIGDISWLDANTPPMLTFQSAYDMVTPYNDQLLISDRHRNDVVRIQGGKLVLAKANELGNNQVFIDANIDDEYTERAKDNSTIAGHAYFEGLVPTVNAPNSWGYDEGVVIDWWDPNAIAPDPWNLPWNMLPHPSGGTFHENGLIYNEGMSAEKARATIDTIFGYFAPRAYAALNLIESGTVNVKELVSNEVNLTAYPNPAQNMVMLSSAIEEPMLDVEVYDLSGRLVRSYYGIDQSYFFLYRLQLADGMYVAKVRFESGVKAKKIMFE